MVSSAPSKLILSSSKSREVFYYSDYQLNPFIIIDQRLPCPSLGTQCPSAAPDPGSVALLHPALASPVCGESVGRTPALGCAQCTCGPLHQACAGRDDKVSVVRAAGGAPGTIRCP
jgi:hypothetical protein